MSANSDPYAAFMRELDECAIGAADSKGFATEAERLAYASGFGSGFTTALVFGPSGDGHTAFHDREALGTFLRREGRKAMRRMREGAE